MFYAHSIPDVSALARCDKGMMYWAVILGYQIIFIQTNHMISSMHGNKAFDTVPSKNEMSILIQFSPSAHLVHI